jgi:hypothetical protein
MSTIDQDTLHMLRRLESELSEIPAADELPTDAQVRAELRAAGIDPDAAYQRMRARFAHLAAPPEPARPLRDLADGIRLLARDTGELIALSLEGLGRLANAYAPAYLSARRRASPLDALAELGQPAIVGLHPRGETVELNLRWPGERPVTAPTLLVSVRGRHCDPDLVRWGRWRDAGQPTDSIEVRELHWPAPSAGAGGPVLHYWLASAQDGGTRLEIELLPEDGDG